MKLYFVLSTLCILVLFCEFSNANDRKCMETGECSVEFKHIGCFKDRSRSKFPAMGGLLITDRNPNSKVKIDWYNYGSYIHCLACRCAEFAKKKGFSYFGLQYYGECWAGPMAEITYRMYGKSTQCANEYFASCDEQHDEECIGRANANFVYYIASESGSGMMTEEV